MFASIVLAAAAAMAPAQPAPAAPGCTAAARATCLAGTWKGPFIGADWTFEFKREGDRWTGRYTTTRSGVWRTLEALVVAGDRVTFVIPTSQPELRFVLALDAAGTGLAGEVPIAGHAALPFAAVRG